MKQVEFDMALCEMRNATRMQLNAIDLMQQQVKKELANLSYSYRLLEEKGARLKEECRALHERRIKIESEKNALIQKFISENAETSRNLENVSEWALVKELHTRGYYGELRHKDKPENFMVTLNKKLNGFQVEEDEEVEEIDNN